MIARVQGGRDGMGADDGVVDAVCNEEDQGLEGNV